MSFVLSRRFGLALVLGTLWFAAASPVSAQQVTVEQILSYVPVQPGVEIESPKPDEIAKCKVDVERSGKGSGWVVYGPAGQVIRRFVDTDGDNTVDQWSYYLHGLEVYRDIDSDGNRVVDQSRWLSVGGTRWGVDSNEDKKIDRWLRLSAEEATREAINAMSARDERLLSTLLIDAQDMKALGLNRDIARQLANDLANPGKKMQEVLSKTRTIVPGTKWVRFDSSLLMPNLVPRESGKADRDVLIYENVMAIVDTGGKNGFVQIGEMVLVGDVWKLTSIPQPIEGENAQVVAGGPFMSPDLNTAAGSLTSLSPEVQKLIDDLQKLDDKAPKAEASAAEAERYNTSRSKLLGHLAELAATQDERDLWQKQRIDGIAAAVQMNAYSNGLGELQAIETQIRQTNPASPLLPYVSYYRLATEYNTHLQTATTEQRSKVQENWVTSLERFVTDYPKSESTPDALLQLGVAHEFLGHLDNAKKWYETLLKDHSSSPAALRAAGAVRRLGLVGNALNLSGSALGGGTLDARSYRGKVLAVVFWATWCRPCTEELPQLIELYKTNQAAGFEVIGVNLDSPGAPVQQYIRQYGVPWKHIAEEGGLESRPAKEYGIITLPTMFLVDKTGKVVSSSVSLEDLKGQLPALLK